MKAKTTLALLGATFATALMSGCQPNDPNPVPNGDAAGWKRVKGYSVIHLRNDSQLNIGTYSKDNTLATIYDKLDVAHLRSINGDSYTISDRQGQTEEESPSIKVKFLTNINDVETKIFPSNRDPSLYALSNNTTILVASAVNENVKFAVSSDDKTKTINESIGYIFLLDKFNSTAPKNNTVSLFGLGTSPTSEILKSASENTTGIGKVIKIESTSLKSEGFISNADAMAGLNSPTGQIDPAKIAYSN